MDLDRHLRLVVDGEEEGPIILRDDRLARSGGGDDDPLEVLCAELAAGPAHKGPQQLACCEDGREVKYIEYRRGRHRLKHNGNLIRHRPPHKIPIACPSLAGAGHATHRHDAAANDC